MQVRHSNYYINKELMELFVYQGQNDHIDYNDSIESVHDER
jgi:hypothetical protein